MCTGNTHDWDKAVDRLTSTRQSPTLYFFEAGTKARTDLKRIQCNSSKVKVVSSLSKLMCKSMQDQVWRVQNCGEKAFPPKPSLHSSYCHGSKCKKRTAWVKESLWSQFMWTQCRWIRELQRSGTTVGGLYNVNERIRHTQMTMIVNDTQTVASEGWGACHPKWTPNCVESFVWGGE